MKKLTNRDIRRLVSETAGDLESDAPFPEDWKIDSNQYYRDVRMLSDGINKASKMANEILQRLLNEEGYDPTYDLYALTASLHQLAR